MRRYSQESHFMSAAYPSTRRDDDRANDARVFEDRPRMDRWTPPQAMGVPQDPDFEYRWTREYVRGEMDPRNVTKALSEGFVVVRIEDLPPGFLVDPDLHGDGYARHGGLLLMRMPRAFADQRNAYYRQRRDAAMQGANELQGVAASESGSRALPVNVEQSRQTKVLRTV